MEHSSRTWRQAASTHSISQRIQLCHGWDHLQGKGHGSVSYCSWLHTDPHQASSQHKTVRRVSIHIYIVCPCGSKCSKNDTMCISTCFFFFAIHHFVCMALLLLLTRLVLVAAYCCRRAEWHCFTSSLKCVKPTTDADKTNKIASGMCLCICWYSLCLWLAQVPCIQF